MATNIVHQLDPLTLKRARVVLLGYGDDAREHALGLRSAGCDVSVGLRLGGMSWVRARSDGFAAQAPSMVAPGARVIVVLVPDDEQASVYYHAIEPHLRSDTLLVFGRALALRTGAVEPKRRSDVVLVSGNHFGPRPECRVAVHHDVTGRALDRAIEYARAAFGAGALVGATTLETEVAAELAVLSRRAGSVTALVAAVERSAARARETHAPDEAKVAFYEGLGDLARSAWRGER